MASNLLSPRRDRLRASSQPPPVRPIDITSSRALDDGSPNDDMANEFIGRTVRIQLRGQNVLVQGVVEGAMPGWLVLDDVMIIFPNTGDSLDFPRSRFASHRIAALAVLTQLSTTSRMEPCDLLSTHMYPSLPDSARLPDIPSLLSPSSSHSSSSSHASFNTQTEMLPFTNFQGRDEGRRGASSNIRSRTPDFSPDTLFMDPGIVNRTRLNRLAELGGPSNENATPQLMALQNGGPSDEDITQQFMALEIGGPSNEDITQQLMARENQRQGRARPRVTRRSRRAQARSGGSGIPHWAGERASDIHESGDFDFEANLARFDRDTVFDQIRAQEEPTAGTRLVDLNRRVDATGTGLAGHLHHAENVLDQVNVADQGDDEVWATGEDPGVLQGSYPNVPMASGPNQAGMALAALPGPTPLHTVHPFAMGVAHPGAMERLSTPAVPGPVPVINGVAPHHARGPLLPRLLLRRTMRPCRILVASQLRAMLRAAEEELFLTDDVMTENAGRNIAQLIFQLMGGIGGGSSAGTRKPRALFLAGNTVTGMRVTAAARHLVNHGWDVRVCVVRPFDPDVPTVHELRRQISRLSMSGGSTTRMNPVTVVNEEARRGLEIIIDGIFGADASTGMLERSKASIAGMARAIAQTNVQVLSVGMPTGIHGSTGWTPLAADETPAYIKSHRLITMGAPTKGLVHAKRRGVQLPGVVYLADVGISNLVWRRFGIEEPEGGHFGPGWIEELLWDEVGVDEVE